MDYGCLALISHKMNKVSCLRSFFWPGLFYAFLFFTLFQGCQEKDHILIGFVAGTSGRVADTGIAGRDAAQMVIEQCNENGGIRGRQVDLLIKDDKQDPETARKAVQELIDQGVSAIIGPMTSDMSMAVTPLLNSARLVAVSPTAATQYLSGRDDYFFRVTSTTREFAAKSALYHIKIGDMRRIVAIYDQNNSSFSQNWLENFKTPFTKNGGEIITAMGFNKNEEQTFLGLTRKLLAYGPDGVLIIASSMDSALLCQQIRKIDSKIPVTLSDWGATEHLLELGGRAVEGVTVVQTFNRDNPNPDYQKFRKAHLKRYRREPGSIGVLTHDATQVLLRALRDQKNNQNLK